MYVITIITVFIFTANEVWLVFKSPRAWANTFGASGVGSDFIASTLGMSSV